MFPNWKGKQSTVFGTSCEIITLTNIFYVESVAGLGEVEIIVDEAARIEVSRMVDGVVGVRKVTKYRSGHVKIGSTAFIRSILERHFLSLSLRESHPRT